MIDVYLGIGSFILAMVALGLVRIVRGPDTADRMMAAQLLGTGGVAILLLFAVATGTHIDRRCRPAACASGCVRRGCFCQRRAGFVV